MSREIELQEGQGVQCHYSNGEHKFVRQAVVRFNKEYGNMLDFGGYGILVSSSEAIQFALPFKEEDIKKEVEVERQNPASPSAILQHWVNESFR